LDLPRLHGLIALDLETHDPFLKKLGPGWCFNGKQYGKIVGIALAFGENASSAYLPIRHETGHNYPEGEVLSWLKDNLEHPEPSLELVYHNGLYDRGWLLKEGIQPKCKQHDTMSMVAIHDEYRYHYSLDECGKDFLGYGKKEDELIAFAKQHGLHPKNDIWRMPGDTIVKRYAAEGDAAMTLLLAQKIYPLLARDNLLEIYDLEMRVQTVLLEMRKRGVRVDLKRAAKVAASLLGRENDAIKTLRDLSGVTAVNVWANRSLGAAADKMGVKYPTTPVRGDPSFQKEWLAQQAAKGCQFSSLVLAARRASKTRTTFIEGHILSHAVNGRVHAQYHPLRSDEGGAVSGRFASSDPNMQNLPNKEEEQTLEDAILVRGVFLPEEGQQWSSLDYSQQEPRLAVHYAALMGVPGSEEAVKAWHDNPRLDLHQFVADLTGVPRGNAKILNLAIMYGEGGLKLCKQLGLPTQWITKNGTHIEVAGEEGQRIIDAHAAKVPWLKRISKIVVRKAQRSGCIRTIGGRLRRFAQEEFDPETRRWEIKPETAHWGFAYKAFNALIQGSAADQLKIAMVTAYEQHGVVPLVSVHDELGVNSDDAVAAQKCMEEAVNLRVPTIVDKSDGPNWGATLTVPEPTDPVLEAIQKDDDRRAEDSEPGTERDRRENS